MALPFCGGEGWEVMSHLGDIPSHDQPDGRHCWQNDDRRLQLIEAYSYEQQPQA